MHVTDTPRVTHNCLWEQRECPLAEESHNRMTRLSGLPIPTTEADALATLQEAAYEKWTIWSIIYRRDKPAGTWFIRRHWSNPHTIEL